MYTSTLQNEMSRGTVELLDVRTELEFNQGHIAGARHLPLDRLLAETSFERRQPDKQLCIICQSGKRAARAQQYLQQLGVESCILDGGMNAWAEAGGAVERTAGTHRFTPMRQTQIVIGLLNLTGIGLALRLSPWWLALPAFTAAGMIFAGITGWCGMALLLARMPWNKAWGR